MFLSPAVDARAVAPEQPACLARRLKLSGHVQGVGVRPAVARLALELTLAGCVSNCLDGVQIDVEGPGAQIDRFERQLPGVLPEAARLDAVIATEILPIGRSSFVIEKTNSDGPLQTQLPHDLAVCPACLAEVDCSDNRRQGYPFTSCTNCGPRYSIIGSMPYERSQTTMAQFEMCSKCRAEYCDPLDRRFHAQTNACPDCGPHIWCSDCNGEAIARRGAALHIAVDRLLQGAIVALRGLGGYQLVCDAISQRAVRRLRERKGRPDKPLAVMALDLESVGQIGQVDAAARKALNDPANPIVLLPVRPGGGLAPTIHPGLNCIGVMLPTTPLHWLLLGACRRPLVVTSGNREGEPLATEVDEALDSLRSIADLWLHHDRPIVHNVDDSVVRIIASQPVTLRLARGLAPLALDLPPGDPTLAVGGHQKAAIALCNGSQSVLGPHIGDLGTTGSRERFVREVAQSRDLYRVSEPVCIHDLHPDYFTTTWARDRCGRNIAIQHHHAHVVASMLEQGWLDREVLGVAFDGTGFGLDGTIWGGEFLLATVAGYRRVAHLREFSLPGGEAAIREPWRVAVSLVQQLPERNGFLPLIAGRWQRPVTSLLPLLQQPRLSPRTTSIGRLFDGIAALVLGVERASYEGQPAMLLEAVAEPTDVGGYSFGVDEQHPVTLLDWRPMLSELLADLAQETPPGIMAMRFHAGLAHAVATICRRFAPRPVALGGGVFQNRLLTELFVAAMQGSNQLVGLPGSIPPNDGGLAAGQLAIGLAQHTTQQPRPGSAESIQI